MPPLRRQTISRAAAAAADLIAFPQAILIQLPRCRRFLSPLSPPFYFRRFRRTRAIAARAALLFTSFLLRRQR